MNHRDEIRHHEHTHDEHCDCEQCNGPVSVHTHESSVIGSFHFEVDRSYDEAQQYSENALKTIAVAVENEGGIIGHIKAVVQAQGESCMISLTDEDVNIKQMHIEQCSIEGAAIVFHIDPDKLQTIVEDAFSSLVSL